MKFKPIYVIKSKLNSLPRARGQYVIVTDTGEVYFDKTDNERVLIANKYILPAATNVALGGIKSGDAIDVAGDGTVSIPGSGHTHPIGNIEGVTVSAKEVNFLAGTSSNIQSSIESKVPKSTAINGKLLNGDISLTASDVSAVPLTRTINNKSLGGNIVLNADDVGALSTGARGSTVASLENGKVPASQLPSFVDDVIEGYYIDNKFYSDASKVNAITGETGKIYVDLTSNKTYRWSGSAYVEISASLALGITSSTAFAGDKGNTLWTNYGTGVNKGSTTTPVYIANGVPTAMTGALPVSLGGTGANNATSARSNLGLGNVATYNLFDISASATNGFDTTRITKISSDGVMDIGRYIDFHYNNTANDYISRITCDSSGNLTLTSGKTITATNFSGLASSASKLTTDAGSTTQPIYFAEGIPKAITGNIANGTTGNAATATKLQVERAINGTSFDGTEDITTFKWGAERPITIGNTQKYVDGSNTSGYKWTVAEIGAVNKAGDEMSGNLTIHNNNPSLKIQNSSNGSSSLMLERSTDYLGWKIANVNSNLLIQNNYTTSVGDYFDVLTLNYNTGNASFKGSISAGKKINANAGILSYSTGISWHELGNISYSSFGVSTEPSSTNTSYFPALSLKTRDSHIFSLGTVINEAGLYAISKDRISGANNQTSPNGRFYFDFSENKWKTNVSIQTNGHFEGNATSATKLTSSAGSDKQPIYFSDGKPVATTQSIGASDVSIYLKNGVLTQGQQFIPLSGSEDIYGTLRSDSEIQSSNPNAFRLSNGSYGTILNQDDEYFYISKTNLNNQYGNSNNLKPFYISHKTGQVNMDNDVEINGSLNSNVLRLKGGVSGNWNIGKEINNSIITINEKAESGNYMPILAGKTKNDNVYNIGQSEDSLYVCGFLSSNTGNNRDWSLSVNTNTGRWYTGEVFEAGQFVGPLQGRATTAGVAEKLGTDTIGSATQPFYLNAGTPTACTSYANATVGTANKLGTDTIGSATQPFYLNAGVPTACTAYASATVGTANKLGTTTVGSATQPFYLNAGTPTACTSYASATVGTANKLGTSTIGSATRLMYLNAGTPTASSSTVGSSTKPVYLSNGVLTACSSELGGSSLTAAGSSTQPVYINSSGKAVTCTAYGNASVNYATSAGTATALGSSAGSATQPVYINSSGKPVACTAYSNASVNYATTSGSTNKFNVSRAIGSSTNPIYINANGVPTACGPSSDVATYIKVTAASSNRYALAGTSGSGSSSSLYGSSYLYMNGSDLWVGYTSKGRLWIASGNNTGHYIQSSGSSTYTMTLPAKNFTVPTSRTPNYVIDETDGRKLIDLGTFTYSPDVEEHKSNNPVYLSESEIIPMKDTIGSDAAPMYLEAGEFRRSTDIEASRITIDSALLDITDNGEQVALTTREQQMFTLPLIRDVPTLDEVTSNGENLAASKTLNFYTQPNEGYSILEIGAPQIANLSDYGINNDSLGAVRISGGSHTQTTLYSGSEDESMVIGSKRKLSNPGGIVFADYATGEDYYMSMAKWGPATNLDKFYQNAPIGAIYYELED